MNKKSFLCFLPLLTGAMFETKAILSQVTSHYPQTPKQHY